MMRSLFAQTAVRRAAALSLLGLTLFAVHAIVVAPLLAEAREQREEAAMLRDALARYLEATRELPALRARLATLEAESRERRGIIEAASETLAAVEVQSRIKAAVGETGGVLRSIEILRAETQEAWPRIAVRARFAIDLAGLQQVLYAINETAPAMLLDGLDIARPERGPRDDDMDGRLEVELNMFGYLARKA